MIYSSKLVDAYLRKIVRRGQRTRARDGAVHHEVGEPQAFGKRRANHHRRGAQTYGLVQHGGVALDREIRGRQRATGDEIGLHFLRSQDRVRRPRKGGPEDRHLGRVRLPRNPVAHDPRRRDLVLPHYIAHDVDRRVRRDRRNGRRPDVVHEQNGGCPGVQILLAAQSDVAVEARLARVLELHRRVVVRGNVVGMDGAHVGVRREQTVRRVDLVVAVDAAGHVDGAVDFHLVRVRIHRKGRGQSAAGHFERRRELRVRIR